MSGKPAPWRDECLRLYQEGIEPAAIASRLKVKLINVECALDIGDARTRRDDASRCSRKKHKTTNEPHSVKNKPHSVRVHWERPKSAEARPKAGEADPRIMAAARAFAAGQIDRAELKRRIAP